MNDGPLSPGRRRIGKLLLTLSAASAVGAEEAKPAAPSETGAFLAAHEPGLSADERDRLAKSIAEAEKSLKVVRDFELPAEIGPAFRFRALKSRRS